MATWQNRNIIVAEASTIRQEGRGGATRNSIWDRHGYVVRCRWDFWLLAAQSSFPPQCPGAWRIDCPWLPASQFIFLLLPQQRTGDNARVICAQVIRHPAVILGASLARSSSITIIKNIRYDDMGSRQDGQQD